MAADPEHDLLATGRTVLRDLQAAAGDDPDRLAHIIQQRVAADEAPLLAAALYAAILDGQSPRRATGRHETGATGLGAAAGLTGHTGDLYRAARVSSDARAVERTVETGNPRYVGRRVRNRLVGRALGRAGVWRRLWR